MKKMFRSLFILSLSASALGGCALDEFFGGNTKVADHIDVREYTAEVFENEKYTFDGKVFAVYEDKTEEDVTEKSEYTTLDTSKLGYQDFVVRYEDAKFIHKKTIQINVKEKEKEIPLESISIPANVSVKMGKTATVTPTFSPSNATNKSVEFKTGSSSIATISSNGEITPVNVGKTTITVTSLADSKIKATANLEIKEASAQAEWTILMYVCGSNLESQQGEATEDLEEIRSVSGQPSDVNIVVQAGGSKKWSSALSSVANASFRNRFHISNKKYVKDSQETKVNMGLASSLQDFVKWGLETYPADKVGFVYWNHGGAITGACFDEQFSEDGLDPAEMIEGISGGKSAAGYSDKFEFIGYDCCLMQFQDLAGLNAPYAKYQVASEESEWGLGWSYDKWVDDLYAGKSTEEVLTALVDGFVADTNALYPQYYGEASDQTQSFVDLSKWSAYESAWESMSQTLNTAVTNWDTFANVLSSGTKYGDYYDLFDIGDFITNMRKSSYKNNATLMSKLNSVEIAYNDLVVYEDHGAAAGNSSGLALFAPVSGYPLTTDDYSESVTTLSTWRQLCVNKGNWYSGGWWW